MSRSRSFFTRISWSRLAIAVILVYGICFNLSRWRTDDWKHLMTSDGIGYYSYLPATFIYKDYSYNFVDSLGKDYSMLRIGKGCPYCNTFEGRSVNKYYAGTAVAVAPFFFAAHAVSGWTGEPQDGFSFYYILGVTLAALSWLGAGLWCLRQLLKRFGITDALIALTLLVIFFGTHLFNYALHEPQMSHVYSFAFVAAFLLVLHRQLETFTAKRLFLLAVLLGMIVLVRPVNGLIVLALPFLAGDAATLKLFFRELFSRPLRLAGALAAGIAVLFIQSLLYYAQSGSWFVDAYSTEHFDFAHPHFFQSLFSYSNGFFVYAPLLLVALAGLFTQPLFRIVSFLAFFAVVVWVISSWWAWTYGGAFGMRPLVEYIPLFALLFALLLRRLSKKRSAIALFMLVLVLPLTALAQLQLWQYRMGIIGWDSMTKEKYWRVFFETRRQFYDIGTDYRPVPPAGVRPVFRHVIDFEKPDSTLDWRSVTDEKAFSGTHALCLRSENNHAPVWKRPVGALIPDSLAGSGNLWLCVRAKWLLEDNGSDARMIFNVQRDAKIFVYGEHYVIHQMHEENKWTDVVLWKKLPPLLPGDLIEVYPRRDNWFPVYVDDLSVEIFTE